MFQLFGLEQKQLIPGFVALTPYQPSVGFEGQTSWGATPRVMPFDGPCSYVDIVSGRLVWWGISYMFSVRSSTVRRSDAAGEPASCC